jgi:hypothetical protein
MRWSSRLCQRRAWAMLAYPACRNVPVTRLRTAAKAAGWFPVRTFCWSSLKVLSLT